MRQLILIAILVFARLFCAAQKPNEIDYLFTNTSIITMIDENVLENKNILVNDGRIIGIVDTISTSIQPRQVVDLQGKFIMPSLSDAHVHLPEKEEDLRKFFILNLINGVTKLRSMRGQWVHLEWKNRYNSAKSFYPKLYLSSPPISKRYNFTDEQLEAYVKSSRKFDLIKILSIKNDLLFVKLDSLVKKEGIKIVGHFPSNIPDTLIFSSNYTSFEHLGGLMGNSEFLQNRMDQTKRKNIFVCPTLSWYNINSGRYSYEELRNQPGMEFISKQIIDDWIEETRRYRDKMGEHAYKEEVDHELKSLDEKYQIIRKLHDTGVKMLLSPDCSSKYMVPGFGMLGEMKLLKNSELSNFDILQMATVNFADFFKEDYGTIEDGKEADFIILNDNPLKNINILKTIEGVFFNKNYLDKDALNDLSKSILLN